MNERRELVRYRPDSHPGRDAHSKETLSDRVTSRIVEWKKRNRREEAMKYGEPSVSPLNDNRSKISILNGVGLGTDSATLRATDRHGRDRFGSGRNNLSAGE